MPVSLRDRAYNDIRRRLLVGEISSGQRLFEGTLAKEIGISRTPVRDAITQLVSEGLVEQVPSGGVVARRVTREELKDIETIRHMHEGYAAYQAAKHISKAELANLRMLVDQMRKLARDYREAGCKWTPEIEQKTVIADVGFHMLILQASHSPWVAKIVSDFQVLTRRYSNPAMQSLSVVSRVLLQHWRIYRALEAGNSKAAKREMQMHIRQGRQRRMRLFAQEDRAERTSSVLGDWSEFFKGLTSKK
jgi:DNA-binding GntR family transcriptional regulator